MKEYPQLYEKENEVGDISVPSGDDENDPSSTVDIPAERITVERSSVASPSNSPPKESLVERPSTPSPLSSSILTEEITKQQPTISSISTEISANNGKEEHLHSVQSKVSSDDSINHEKSTDSLTSVVDPLSAISVNNQSSNLPEAVTNQET